MNLQLLKSSRSHKQVIIMNIKKNWKIHPIFMTKYVTLKLRTLSMKLIVVNSK